ncbi:glutathione S-transferase family protein [Pseudaminobacter sp. 19-2017]|uniref:Glutathione S-transferase family protein n=1 Tax=Pseudaminobacter soli (ex Zhang et al. 2022) TaxID=2831468 RepID=A0A942IBA8_9HYPH|nr:glutathione S-transferase family protein [Pseudaminobacter soli]MBS3652115.1 glutathione S-transferase family protein [Pseudaminobacter soli]
MTIKLYDYSLSGSCYKVRLLLHFLDLHYEKQQIDFYPGRQHKSLDFLQINPLGQIPALEDDGLQLRDAQAILCHLANKYDGSGRWLPRDERHFGAVMMWVMFAGGELMSASAARLHDALGYKLDINAARASAHAAFRILDDHMTLREIEGAKWIVGDHPTIADIACFPYVALSGDGGIGHEDYPALRNWMRNFRRLPRFHAMSGVPEYV